MARSRPTNSPQRPAESFSKPQEPRPVDLAGALLRFGRSRYRLLAFPGSEVLATAGLCSASGTQAPSLSDASGILLGELSMRWAHRQFGDFGDRPSINGGPTPSTCLLANPAPGPLGGKRTRCACLLLGLLQLLVLPDSALSGPRDGDRGNSQGSKAGYAVRSIGTRRSGTGMIGKSSSGRATFGGRPRRRLFVRTLPLRKSCPPQTPYGS